MYVCSAAPGEAGTRLALIEESPAPRFRLRNRSGVAFTTADGWWTVARYDGEWRIVTQGEGGERRTVEPGDALAWTLSLAGGAPAGGREVSLALGEGRYAFAVSGYVRRGELTGLVAPFAVRGGR